MVENRLHIWHKHGDQLQFFLCPCREDTYPQQIATKHGIAYFGKIKMLKPILMY